MAIRSSKDCGYTISGACGMNGTPGLCVTRPGYELRLRNTHYSLLSTRRLNGGIESKAGLAETDLYNWRRVQSRFNKNVIACNNNSTAALNFQ